MTDYDEATAFLGQWGRFQQIVFFLICAIIVPNGLIAMCVVFVAANPDHHCLIPELNLTQPWHNATIPKEMVDGTLELSRCSRFRLDVVRNLSAQGLVPGRDVNLTDLEQEGCVDGWSYSKDIYQSTLVTEFDLVCSDQWKKPFTSTVLFLGILFGAFFSGQVADRFGRKPVLFAAMALQSVPTICQMFAPSWIVFCILFFITGVGRVSSYLSAFVLGAEILTGKVRVLFSSLGVCLSFSVGYMLLPLFAYFLRDWKHLLFGISLVSLMYLPLWWIIPESPRWLVSQKRVAEAEAILRRAAKSNKVEAPVVIFRDYDEQAEEIKKQPEKRTNVLHLLNTSNIRNITLTLCLVWFTLTTGYYGLSLNTSQLHTDPYISSFMSAAVEIPAYISIWLGLQFCRRRLCLLCLLFTAALALLVIQLVPQDLPYLAVALEMLGKFAVTAGTSLMYVYVAELYPTVLRNTAAGACSILSRVGASMSSFLFNLGVYFKYLPYIILGTLAALAFFSSLFLPETFGRPLPQTIEQMPHSKRIKCPFRHRKRKITSVVMESQM